MNTTKRNQLKAQAHHLKPVIIIGAQGVTEALLEETNHALEAHELIKIKANADDKAARKAMALEICDALEAEFVQLIGNIAIIYRKKKKHA